MLKLSAPEILDKLLKLNPNVGEEARNRIFRQIVHHLQMLVDLGPEALPVVQAFLQQNKDVDYAGEPLNESGERIRTGFTSRYVTRTDFLVPPSLRLAALRPWLKTLRRSPCSRRCEASRGEGGVSVPCEPSNSKSGESFWPKRYGQIEARLRSGPPFNAIRPFALVTFIWASK